MEGQGLSRGRNLLASVRIRKMQLKIVLVGERRVGKTSLLERYLKNHFAEAYTGTPGGRVYPTDLEVALEGEDIALAHIAFFDLMGFLASRRSRRFSLFPAYVSLSRTTTSCPCPTALRVKFEPMNPAPPVTRRRVIHPDGRRPSLKTLRRRKDLSRPT